MFVRFISFFKSVYFNLRFLPIRQAAKLPFAIHYKCKCDISGEIKLQVKEIKPFMIRLGFHTVTVAYENISLLKVEGVIIFCGTAHIGRGTKIYVGKNGILELGDHFAISASSYIHCHKHIKIGVNVQLAWGVLMMDSDTHYIFDENGIIINNDKEIVLGNKIWIGCDSKVLKGSVIPSNCVIGANTMVLSTSLLESNSIIVGNPAKSIKRISGFKI